MANHPEKLTPGRIRKFACGTGKTQDFTRDASSPLMVRATLAGSKAFVFEGKLNRKTIRVTLGSTDSWLIDEARAEARRLQTLIDRGIDPREEKAERIAATEAKREASRRQEATVAEAWGAYVAAHRAKWSPRHLADHEEVARLGGEDRKRGAGKIEPGPLAALLSGRLADLTPERVASWLDAETARRPTYAARAFRLLRAFVRWCASRAEYSGAANLEAVGSRVAKDHLPRARSKEGDSLQREQLPAWFVAVRELDNPVIAAYLQGLLLTGARREELAGLTWEAVDFQWRSLRIHDKVTGERTIPLPPYLASLLAALPRRNAWVFSSLSAVSGRIQEPRIAHTRALTAAGLPHVSLHGLRRSFGTLAEWVEAPTGVTAQIMGHKPSAIAEKHYRRRPLDLLRMWHVRIEAFLLEQAGIPQPGEGATGLRVVTGTER